MRLDKNTLDNIKKEIEIILAEHDKNAIANAKENLPLIKKVPYNISCIDCLTLPVVTLFSATVSLSVFLATACMTIPLFIAAVVFINLIANQCIAEAKAEDYIVDEEVNVMLFSLQAEFSSVTNLPHFLSYHYHNVNQYVTRKRNWRELV